MSKKLTIYQVYLIKALRGSNAKKLGAKFGVSPRTIYHIWNNKTWRQL